MALKVAGAAARSPLVRRVVIALLALILVVVLLPIAAIVAVVASPPAPGAPGELADIPPDYLAAYEAAAARYHVDWSILAAVGKVECDHGRDTEPGCRPYTANSAGAVGPMQFLPPTWAAGHKIGEVRIAIAPVADGHGYATDGDGDGVADVWNPTDAVAGAARMLAANGAPHDYRRALFAYNHAGWYVDRVLAIAARYRAAAGLAGGDVVAVLAYAQRFVGSPYVWGGNHGLSLGEMRSEAPSLAPGKDGRRGYFDCSSLVAWAFANGADRYVGDDTFGQWQLGATTPGATRSLGSPLGGFRAGDIVFFFGLDHVGIALDADRFIHASHTGDDVKISAFAIYAAPYGYIRFAGGST